MNGNNEEWVSKTQMKKRMDELQDLGMELTRLSDETLKNRPARRLDAGRARL